MTVTYYTVKEAAELFRVSENLIRKHIKSGDLAASKIGRGYLIGEESIKAFFESQRKA